MGLVKLRLVMATMLFVVVASLLILGAGRRRTAAALAQPARAQVPVPSPPVAAPAVQAPAPTLAPEAQAPATPAQPVSPAPAAAPQAAPAPGHAGMIAAIDPATGKFVVPMRAHRLALEGTVPALDRSDVGLVPIALPGGGEMVRLEGRFNEYAIARLDSTGRLHEDCVPGPEVAEHLAPAAPARVPVEK